MVDPFVQACIEKQNQCFSGGTMIISASLIKLKMDAERTFVKVSRYDIPSELFLKKSRSSFDTSDVMRCIASKSSDNDRC